MLRDILSDTPAYKEIKREGLAEGRLHQLHEILLAIVYARFPKLVMLTQQVIKDVQDASVLHSLVVQMSMVQNESEAQAAMSATLPRKRRRRK